MQRVFSRAVLLAAVLVFGLLPASPGLSVVAEPAPYAAPAVGEGIDYVALGDSYSAGPLVPEPRPDPAACLRSTVTCSGARSRDVRRPGPTVFGASVPAQADALSEVTDLVTPGMGGNDFGLFGRMLGICPGLRADDPEGDPCRRHFVRTVRGERVNVMVRDAHRIAAHIELAVALIVQRAPNADVYVVGYPRLLPETGTCDQVPFATGDYAWAGKLARILNRSLQSGAEAGGATYLSTYDVSLGHDACAGEDAWINGYQTRFGVAASYHPFKAGLRGVAATIYEQIAGLTAPYVEDAAPPPGSVVTNPAP